MRMHVVPAGLRALLIVVCLFVGAAAARAGDPPLTAVWAAGESTVYFRAMTADGQGSAYGVGETYVSGSEGNSFTACVVTRYDAGGKLLWSRQARHTGSASSFYAVAADDLGNVYAAGTMWGREIDFGNKVKLQFPDAHPGAPSSRIFLVKYDAKGQALWAQAGPARERTEVSSLAADAGGNVYLVGYLFAGEEDPTGPLVFLRQSSKLKYLPDSTGDAGGYFLAKFDAKGNALWAAMPQGGWVTFSAIVADAAGVSVIGRASGERTTSFGGGVLLAGSPDGERRMLARYSSSGAAQWVRAAAFPDGYSSPDYLAVDAGGDLYVAGAMKGGVACDFGNGVSATGSSEITPVLVKYDQNGKAQWARTTVSGAVKWYVRGVAADGAGVFLALQMLEGNASELCDLGNGVGFTGGYAIARYAPNGDPRWAVKTPGSMSGTWGLYANRAGQLFVMADAAYGAPSDFGNGVVLEGAKRYIARYVTGQQAFATCIDARVRVRSSGKLDAGTLGYLEKGDRVEVLEKSAEKVKVDAMDDYWYKVRRLSDGLAGWSYGAFLKLEQ
jgi:hypothetical protein